MPAAVDDYEFQRLHGMGEALYHDAAGGIARLPAASMRRSAAMTTCWPISCGGCWRTAPIPPSCRWRPIRRCRSRPCCGGRALVARPLRARHPRIPLPRDLFGRSGAIRPVSNSATAPALDALLAEIGSAPHGEGCAADRRRRGRRPRAQCRFADRRQAIGIVEEGDEAIVAAAMPAAQAGFPSWDATPVADTRRRAGARRRSDRADAAA